MDTEKIEEWFNRKLPDILEDGSSYPIFLVAIGEKPGALTMNVDEDQEKALREICWDLDLEIKVSQGRISKPDVTVGERPEHDQRCAFIARNEERMEILEDSKGRFYGFSDGAVGKFLGFPESAIKFFEENEQPGMVSKKAVLDEDLQGKELLALTTFIPNPENLEEAVEIGRKRKKQLKEFDNRHDTDVGRKFIEKRLENSLY